MDCPSAPIVRLVASATKRTDTEENVAVVDLVVIVVRVVNVLVMYVTVVVVVVLYVTVVVVVV